MENKKTYTLSFGPTMWECRVLIDFDFIIPARGHDPAHSVIDEIHGMVEFWDGWQEHLSENKGDYINAFLQRLARKIYYLMAAYNCALKFLIDKFYSMEGWCRMDGACGIKIIQADEFEASLNEFEVLEDPQL